MSEKNEGRLKDATRDEDSVITPAMFNVIMHNDDITTMDFVVDVLVRIYHKNYTQASHVMMEVHNKQKGVAGTYTYDIAVTKKIQTDQLSKERGFPLKLTLEEAI